MMRKEGKMPNTIKSSEYDTEYGKRSGLTVQKDRIKKGDRVLIIDDLVATGGTLSSAIQLVKACGGTVVECACVVELKMFRNRLESRALPVYIFCEPFHILFEEFWFLLSHSPAGVFCAFQGNCSIEWKFWVRFREGQWEFNHVVLAYSCSLYNVFEK